MDPVRIRIDNRVRVDVTHLDEAVIAELKEAFEHSNPEFHKRQAMGFATWSTPRKIKTWKLDDDGPTKTFEAPRGGAIRIRDVLDKFGLNRHYEDARALGHFVDLRHRVELWQHQETLVDAGIAAQNCILKAPTGSGKTCMAHAIAGRLKVTTLVIVSTTALFKQWLDRAQKELGLKKKDIGQIRGKVRRLMPLTIAMQKTLATQGIDEELNDYFGCVICDEVQLFAAKTFIEAVDPFRAKYRIGISADHRRKDKKEFLIHDLFGEVAAEVFRKDLIEKKVIVDTIVRVVPSEFEAPWYGKPETEEDDRKSTFGPEDFEPPPEKELDWKRLLDEMCADEKRMALTLWCVRDGLRTDDQVIVMTHRREMCRALDHTFVVNGLTTGFLIGGDDFAREFDDTRQRFEKRELQVAVGTFQAIGYGIDLPKAAIVVCATPIAANKQFFNQVRGRVCRSAKGKTESWMYYVWDERVYGDEPLKNLKRWNNGRVVVWSSGKWVDVKEFMRARRIAAFTSSEV
jgi:superfamily II DNA or RNA helicase